MVASSSLAPFMKTEAIVDSPFFPALVSFGPFFVVLLLFGLASRGRKREPVPRHHVGIAFAIALGVGIAGALASYLLT